MIIVDTVIIFTSPSGLSNKKNVDTFNSCNTICILFPCLTSDNVLEFTVHDTISYYHIDGHLINRLRIRTRVQAIKHELISNDSNLNLFCLFYN